MGLLDLGGSGSAKWADPSGEASGESKAEAPRRRLEGGISQRIASLDARKTAARLAVWYRDNRRDLPWRRSRNPYRVWISEIMLQQTQVATVIPYYRAFLRRFPTLRTLAAAGEEEVLSAWSGLGYYRRARHVHAAARRIQARHGGRFPADFDALRRLPGIGRYTAGALGSIAFGLREAALDGNAERVLTRLMALRGDPARTEVRKVLEETARAMMQEIDPADINQALMELGALVCRPIDPLCPRCPLTRSCRARWAGRAEDFPQHPPTRKVRSHRAVVAVIRKGGRYLERRRNRGEMMAGLWEFPGDLLLPAESMSTGLARVGRERLGRELHGGKSLARFTQHITTRRIEVSAFAATVSERFPAYGKAAAATRWLAPPDIRKLPHGSATARLLEVISEGVPPPSRRRMRAASRRRKAPSS